ncbi:uncharacterized protein LOC113209394 [Frankliniella occidentalis]|uniref:Uncharacterized protein LOC113209394 n=1 Tax=Frankliniella occidentalis TaxID=133901 RepID=A0A9C6UED1_FRAOC|nr:uncharacterized protein LOC113209394 [Frankliniella occidentalis]
MLRLVVPQAVEVLNRQLEWSVAQLGEVEQALERRVQREAAGDVGTTSDAVEEPLQLAEQLEASHRLLTSTKCTVAAEEEGGSSWTASVQPGGCGDILRVLLLRLRADGQLGEVDDAIAVTDGPAAAHVGPPLINILTINDAHLQDGSLKVNDILRDVKKQWNTPRSLRHLRGDGSEDLLRVIGPHLEELEIWGNVQPSVMEEVQKMSGLRRLEVECAHNVEYPDLPLQLEELSLYSVTENQLRCVERMPRLRSLTINNYCGPNLTVRTSQHDRLVWLGVAIDTDHKPTMLSIIRANASSLQELRVFCSYSPIGYWRNYYFPDLGQELAACGLRVLRRLVLLRHVKNGPCLRQAADCMLQQRTIRRFLPPSVEVVCGVCQSQQF